MAEELSVPIKEFNHSKTQVDLPEQHKPSGKSVYEIYKDQSINHDQQDRLVIQAILDKQNVTSEKQQVSCVKLVLPEEQPSAREVFIGKIREKADIINRAKNWITSNQDSLWTTERAEIWNAMHSSVFPDEEYGSIVSRQGDFVSAVELGLAKFISDFDFIKKNRERVIENPDQFIESSFASDFKGKLLHISKVVPHPVGFICYLHQEDYNKIEASESGRGGYIKILKDNPEFSGKVIIINTGETDPTDFQTEEREITLDHEIKHAVYDHFFRTYDIFSETDRISFGDDEDHVSPDNELHKRNSARTLKMFLEDDKSEAVSYHTKNTNMYASENKGEHDRYKIFCDIIANKILKNSDLPSEMQMKISEIYEADFKNYDRLREELLECVDLVYYVGVEELHLPSDIIDTLIQIMPVDRIKQFVKVVLNIKDDTELHKQIRWYQDTPSRKALEAADEEKRFYAVMRELEKEGVFDRPDGKK
jgi:hypothetical protein